MGSYTPNFNFYKPDSTEFVDVNHNWNYNLQIADSYTKPIMEWSYDTAPNINGAKFYDSSRNDLVVYWEERTGSQSASQKWNDALTLLFPPFVSFGDDDAIQYRLTENKVEFAGRIQNGPDGPLIPLNTTTQIMSGLGAKNIAPLAPKTFNVTGADSVSGYCFYQIAFGIDGTVSIKRFGNDPDIISTLSFVDLSGIYYDTGKNS